MSISSLDLLALTYNSLRSNPLRSVLTMLGVFMGVASVSATLNIGSISRSVMEQQLAEREAPQLLIQFRLNDGRKLQLDDMEFLKQRMTGLQAISADNWFSRGQVIFQDRRARLSLVGVSQDYLLTKGESVLQGRFFNADDFANYQPSVVIDEFLAKQLFQGQNPIGKRVYAADKPYIVIGVVETKLRSADDQPRGEILVSMSISRVLTGSSEIGTIQLRPNNIEDIKYLEKQAKELLLQRYPGGRFWSNNNMNDILEQRETLTFVSRGLLLLGIITLLVGGVGVANITLASVAERTQEIGLLRAIGATQTEIALIFILEAIMLSLIGGTVAITTVHGATIIIAHRFELPYEFQLETAALALGSSLTVGLGSVFFPAVQATKLDPVKALRS
ncbi:ABC transporter permease [Crocosphaera sp.]|uniref:ABC transporter permease n=1 Tax=Crocosphaera sp. TaxID=2729996 RepID=UPI0026162B7B|nr:ABC transporter permease [Crocosphaera sp.]MDJ0579412.1 ABC transporter permease [Crocosphaera sp.]